MCKSMKDTQIVNVLVGLEPDLNVFNIEEVKKNVKIVKIIEVSNGKTRVRCKYCNNFATKM